MHFVYIGFDTNDAATNFVATRFLERNTITELVDVLGEMSRETFFPCFIPRINSLRRTSDAR
jgi:hypothetical protein